MILLMISFLQPLPVGNAVRVLLAPPASAVAWRVLRKTADTFAGHADPTAGIVHEGTDDALVDIAGLVNGQAYYYRPYYLDALGAWTGAPSVSVTPAATAGLIGVDPPELIRERLEAGLKAMVQSAELSHDDGYIPCLTQPPTFEGSRFPIVTVHLQNLSRVASGVGEILAPDAYNPILDEWTELEGWFCAYQIQIVSWVIANTDERLALRRAIAKVLLANLPVLSAKGLTHVEFTQTDIEDMESYGAPVFQTLTSLSCYAPLAVDATSPPIGDVSIQTAFA